ncbi:hypothetical protein [Croceicoccus naphthovorans]|uniref:Uncharacterized protein n=2 Tax=Croceicoccus naphthovorans TaxID=1348774 RepID=A0A0G3XF45_9SPHN|nr:hypothetical protein [Croceicoccus naphthovorans]AKM10130.1 hypothetical protein AB433_09325 [Croceicoccus naphthovorans]MBB3991581.1 hypothetical protein [Croceicoccus naphthovorans]
MSIAAILVSPLAMIAAQAAEPASAEPVSEPVVIDDPVLQDVEDVPLDDRRRPGIERELPDPIVQDNEGAVRAPPPEAFYTKYDGSEGDLTLDVALPDRARITSTLCPAGGDTTIYTLYPNLRSLCRSKLDPFHHNLLKGDRPLGKGRPGFLKGEDWYLILTGISDTVVEPRSFPIPVGVQTTSDPDRLDVFGRSDSLVLAQTFIAGVSLLKGMTAFKPPAVEYRLTLAGQYNYVDVPERRVLEVEPSEDSERHDMFVGVQEAFVDYHLARFDSKRYDFFSVRAGIQPWQSDFRGFLFQDNQLGIRFFGNRDNNRWQFNAAAFWRVEKDTNSGLNDITQSPRDDYVFTANVYRQDFPVVGMTSQLSVTYNMNREAGDIEVDKNGFPVRPALLGNLRGRDYDVVYFGHAMDGHFGRVNLTTQLYGAFGEDRNDIFTDGESRIQAFFAAAEASYDVNWLRFRLSGLYASGDGDPYDGKEKGFDAIFENPVFAGADTSYWIRQTIPFAGGGRAIGVNGRNGILNSLRSSKEQGQSNFNNPGTILVGAGVDADLTPDVRVSANWNHLWFDKTDVVQVLRSEGSIPTSIGHDISVAGIWRPWANQNAVLRLSGAVFDPSAGFGDLFVAEGRDDRFYSILANATFAF